MRLQALWQPAAHGLDQGCLRSAICSHIRHGAPSNGPGLVLPSSRHSL